MALIDYSRFFDSLTTATFSAEVVSPLQEGRLLWAGITISVHVVGSLLITIKASNPDKRKKRRRRSHSCSVLLLFFIFVLSYQTFKSKALEGEIPRMVIS